MMMTRQAPLAHLHPLPRSEPTDVDSAKSWATRLPPAHGTALVVRHLAFSVLAVVDPYTMSDCIDHVTNIRHTVIS